MGRSEGEAETSPPRGRWRRGRRWRIAIFAIACALSILAVRRPLFYGNLAEVDPGRVYRSAQPQANLERLARELHLAAVINLRGGRPSDRFYAEEVATANRLGIEFYDLPLSATHRPSRHDLLSIVALFRRCRYPVLIHCKWGADRTGMVSAVYRMMVLCEPPEKALESFTIAHGHVPLFGPERLQEPFREYSDWLKKAELAHTPERFLEWIEHDYRAADPFAGVPELAPGPRGVSREANLSPDTATR